MRELSGRFYMVLLVMFVGPAGVGAFVAAGTLARVGNPLIRALETLLPPMASRLLKQKSRADMEGLLRWAALIGDLPQVLLVALILVFAKELLHVAYGDTYDEFAPVLRIMSIAYFLRFLSLPLRTALKSVEATSVLFIVGALAAVFLVTGGALLAALAGVTGVAWAFLIKHSISLVAFKLQYRAVNSPQADAK